MAERGSKTRQEQDACPNAAEHTYGPDNYIGWHEWAARISKTHRRGVMDRTLCPARIHGSQWAYKRHRCRCPAAVQAARANWRRRSKAAVRGSGIHHSKARRDGPDPTNVEVALRRVHRGDPPPLLNLPERRAVIAALSAAGWSAAHIATRLGLSQRSVTRHRAKTRQTADRAA